MSEPSWIERSDVYSLFPSLVWKIELAPGTFEPINRRVRALLERRRGDRRLAAGEAWQSSARLHVLPELGELVSIVDAAMVRVLRFLHIERGELDITGCWATVYAPGAAHRMHSHPNNFLSAVYYLRVQPGADAINFHDPRPQTGVLRPPVTELTGQNTDQVVVQVGVGTLLVFPSWLPHSVDPNGSEAERISISFNAMFRAFNEAVARPLWGED